ncbi:hypothetical protein BV25DRAFT_1993201 [Artomyces pyxidatus]|uniref:Uncharacterized protein n=1 Tax=Artomyces pyxidatus TaxID=48021 RepID=A0ACB8SVR5_9AGAM|nr:hypothetical protein BV25DRAFT_1993201 [Artomyces pyxidatus]
MIETPLMQMPGETDAMMSELDIELSNLLNSMTLQQKSRPSETPEPVPTPPIDDVHMSDEESSQSDTSESSSSSAAPPSPCALLEAISRLYEDDDHELEHFPTTCGEYLELIFTHRELFAAEPRSHTGCPAAFSALARVLELRAWRADREADIEAVNAFRHEAWMIAAWMSSGGMWWNAKEGTA